MKPVDKNPDIRRFQSLLTGTDVVADITADKCVSCGGPATAFSDALSAREFGISGLCQGCQDVAFAVLDDEEDV